jgi:ribonuclease J
MKSNIEIAKQLGYLKANKGTFINLNQLKDYKDDKLIILCTGLKAKTAPC